MSYSVRENFTKNMGFIVTGEKILEATNKTNDFLLTLPENLYRSIDYKTASAIIGSLFCDNLANSIDGACVNPIEKGHPDIIPSEGLGSGEETLRNYPIGLEIKGTIGNIKKGTNLRAGQKRIDSLCGITWQAHHREVRSLLSFIWDFVSPRNEFYFPTMTGIFFSENLVSEDWGEISGITGRNTKVTGMLKSGKIKMGEGWILFYDDPLYISKYKSFLGSGSTNE